MNALHEYGIQAAPLVLPAPGIDMTAWAVIACDQYTQDADYWRRAEAAAEGRPSALNLILPEVYLNAPDRHERIRRIHETMRQYLAGGVLVQTEPCFMYIERTTAYGRTRRGLIACIDLDAYDWKPESAALIRATEETIAARLPPRMDVRRGAALELPHIMLLADDADDALMQAAKETAQGEPPVYDAELMLNGGHIRGWRVPASAADKIARALGGIAARNTDAAGRAFLFAVGDGNHSLAAAKAVWDEYRAARAAAGEDAAQTAHSPLRYALVEIVNIYDAGIVFEPIHRVLFGAEPAQLIQYVRAALGGTVRRTEDRREAERAAGAASPFVFAYAHDGGGMQYLILDTDIAELAVSRLQPVLDSFIRQSGAEIDYIHGSDEVFRLGEKKQTIGLLLPPIVKDNFFSTIAAVGCLPRKSFSMGEADEKRFYLEARRLFS